MTSPTVAISGQLSFDDVLQASSAPAPDLIEPVGLEDEPRPNGATDFEAEETVDIKAVIDALDRQPLELQVIRSSKRRKTAQAQMVGAVLEVRIPARCSASEEQQLIEHFRTKFQRSRSLESVDLARRSAELADEYSLPRPTSIRWVSNQHRRWGSCTPVDGSIRLSDRLVAFPSWVVDYVIVHEMAHLVVEAHSAAFWKLVEAYPLTERAKGYLIAKSDGC